MTIRLGVIIHSKQEHVTTLAYFNGMLNFVETWLKQNNRICTLGVILNASTWEFDEYNLTQLTGVTVSIQSFANAYEQHFNKDEMLNIIHQLRELITKPTETDHDIVVLALKEESWYVLTANAKHSDLYPYFPVHVAHPEAKTND